MTYIKNMFNSIFDFDNENYADSKIALKKRQIPERGCNCQWRRKGEL